MSETQPTRYRFGPLERRGLVAGWRGGQIGAVAVALVVGVAVLRVSASPVGVVVALAHWRSGSVSPRGRSGSDRRRVGPRRTPPRRDPRSAVSWWAGPVHRGPAHPGRSQHAETWHPGRIPAQGESACSTTGLVGPSPLCWGRRTPGSSCWARTTRRAAIGAWAGVLASLAREGSAVHRVQWVERVVPADVMSVPAPPRPVARRGRRRRMGRRACLRPGPRTPRWWMRSRRRRSATRCSWR